MIMSTSICTYVQIRNPQYLFHMVASSCSVQLCSTQTETDSLKPTQCLNVENYTNFLGSTAAQYKLPWEHSCPSLL